MDSNAIMVGEQPLIAVNGVNLSAGTDIWDRHVGTQGLTRSLESNGWVMRSEGVEQREEQATVSATLRFHSDRGFSALGIGLSGGLGNPRQNSARLLTSLDGTSWNQVGEDIVLDEQLTGDVQFLGPFDAGTRDVWVRWEGIHWSNTFPIHIGAVRIVARPAGLDHAIALQPTVRADSVTPGSSENRPVPLSGDGQTLRLAIDTAALPPEDMLIVRNDVAPVIHAAPKATHIDAASPSRITVSGSPLEAGFMLLPSSYSAAWRLDEASPFRAGAGLMAFYWSDRRNTALLQHQPEDIYRELLVWSAVISVICLGVASSVRLARTTSTSTSIST
jgi:hypothetical protein